MDTTLKAISIRQPWIDLILKGHKTIELRGWDLSHRGPLALHASKKIDYHAARYFGYEKPWELPSGAILAVAEVNRTIELSEANFGDHLDGHLQILPANGITYGIVLEQVRPLDKPVPARGRLSTFTLTSVTADKVLVQILR